MRSQERESWVAQLEAERAERAKDRVAYLEALDKAANDSIAERAAWAAHLSAEREARTKESAEFSETIAALLERLERVETAAREERAQLLDRIRPSEPAPAEPALVAPIVTVQPPDMPPDMEELSQVGGIVPEGVQVGMGDDVWPPPEYPQTPFAGSEP